MIFKEIIGWIGIFAFASIFLGTSVALVFFGFAMAAKVFVASALVFIFAILLVSIE
jgi:hypothetical protein